MKVFTFSLWKIILCCLIYFDQFSRYKRKDIFYMNGIYLAVCHFQRVF